MEREPTVAQIEAACRRVNYLYDRLPKNAQISQMVECQQWWRAICDTLATTSPQPDSPTPPSQPQS